MICITPNPAIDRTLLVPGFHAGEVWRADNALAVAGGKGLNVARAAAALGATALCMGFLAGAAGRTIERLALEEGLRGRWTWVGGESRICTIVVDPASGSSTVLNERGPAVSVDDWARLQADLLSMLAAGSYVCVSGSLPHIAEEPVPAGGSKRRAILRPAVEDEAAEARAGDWATVQRGAGRGALIAADRAAAPLGALVRAAEDAGARVWVDSSGAALRAAVAAAPAGIKVNAEEVSQLLGRPVASMDDACLAGRELQGAGVGAVVITLGAQGAVLAHPSGLWWALPPALSALSATGSGDAFLAGWLASLEAEQAPEAALRHAVACGAANALQLGGGRIRLADVLHIQQTTLLTALL